MTCQVDHPRILLGHLLQFQFRKSNPTWFLGVTNLSQEKQNSTSSSSSSISARYGFSDMIMFLAKQTTHVINHVVQLRPRLLVVDLVTSIASVNLGRGHYALSIRTVQRRIGGWLLGQKTRLSGLCLATRPPTPPSPSPLTHFSYNSHIMSLIPRTALIPKNPTVVISRPFIYLQLCRILLYLNHGDEHKEQSTIHPARYPPAK